MSDESVTLVPLSVNGSGVSLCVDEPMNVPKSSSTPHSITAVEGIASSVDASTSVLSSSFFASCIPLKSSSPKLIFNKEVLGEASASLSPVVPGLNEAASSSSISNISTSEVENRINNICPLANSSPVSSSFSSSSLLPLYSSPACSPATMTTEEDSRLDEVRRFVAPLSKEQLIDLVAHAAINHQEVYMKCTQAVASSPSARRLMVRNVPFSSRDDAFVGLFQSFGEIDDALIVREKDGRSRGYGFVTYKCLDSVRKCLVTPIQLDGKELQVKLAADPFTYSDQRKLFVRNLAESTDSDSLRNVFSQFGALEECVVISYGHGKSKYGFITYVNASDAFKAIQQSEKIIDGRVVFIHFASPSNSKSKGGMTGCGIGGHHETQGGGGGRVSARGMDGGPGGGGHFGLRGDHGYRGAGNGRGGVGGSGGYVNFRSGGNYGGQANGPYGYAYAGYGGGMYTPSVGQGFAAMSPYPTISAFDYYGMANQHP